MHGINLFVPTLNLYMFCSALSTPKTMLGNRHDMTVPTGWRDEEQYHSFREHVSILIQGWSQVRLPGNSCLSCTDTHKCFRFTHHIVCHSMSIKQVYVYILYIFIPAQECAPNESKPIKHDFKAVSWDTHASTHSISMCWYGLRTAYSARVHYWIGYHDVWFPVSISFDYLRLWF